jgi:putative PIN family toxin of toxin-antitoxin system
VRVVVDTNVLISGIFFTGPPHKILEAWVDETLDFVVTTEILEEYWRVAEELATRYPDIDVVRALELLVVNTFICAPATLPHQVSEDPDDDKFIACAMGGNAGIIISGDRHLLRVSGFQGIEVLRPRDFVDTYLSS